MSQHDLTIANQGFPAFRADLNDALQALGSCQSGTSAPSPTFANQLWYDTTNNILKIRNEDNDAWISIATLDQTTDAISVLSAATVNAGALNTTGNTVLGDASTDTLNVGAGGLVKDASGNVGIGISSPASALNIGAGGAARFNRADNATYNEIKYVTSGDQFYFNQNNNGNYTFNFAGTEKIRFTSAGDIVLAGGNASANGVGITFPATQSASSDANTLDDYEEGTWTPVATAQTGSITSYATSGRYTKIGRNVFVTGVVQLTNIGSASGNMNIAGLPFTTSTGGQASLERPNVSVARENAATGVFYGVYVNPTDTTFSISSLTFGAIAWSNSYAYTFSFTYQQN